MAAKFTLRRPRGGPHNRASRESYGLNGPQVANLQAATAHAKTIGLPFTRMITIHWETAGVALEDMAGATGQFLDRLSKMLARHNSKAAWLWVHENGYNKGGHCHMLMHVPAHLVARLSKRQRGWIKAISGRPYTAKAIFSRPIGGWLGLEVTNPDLWAENLATALGYVYKGADHQTAQQYGLTRHEFGGRIIGKRCGVSQNISTKARALYRPY